LSVLGANDSSVILYVGIFFAIIAVMRIVVTHIIKCLNTQALRSSGQIPVNTPGLKITVYTTSF
jgi:hypothetical protein